MSTIAFIGLGIMGAPMAGHLLAAGHTLHLHSRTRSKAEALIAAGGVWHDNPSDAAAAADIVATMVGMPRDVEQLYLAPGGAYRAGTAGRHIDRHDHLDTFACRSNRKGGSFARSVGARSTGVGRSSWG